MRSDRLVFEGLDAAHRRDANQGLRRGKIELENTRLGQEAPELRIGTALLSNAASPWGSAAQIKAGGITLNLASHDLRLDSLSAQTLLNPQGKAKAIDFGPLAFEAGEERVYSPHSSQRPRSAPNGVPRRPWRWRDWTTD